MNENIQQLDQKYIAHTYNRFPVEIAYGKGSEVFDPSGKRYIDMGSGIGVTSFGIADDEWQAAVTAQLGKVQHMSNLYYTAPDALLAAELCARTGMKKVFFANSGAEANECAIKVARKYAAEQHGPDCFTILTLKNSFHGRTLTTLAATGQEHYHELYQPLTPGFASVATDLASLESMIHRTNPAGLLIECVQGEGGVNVLDADFVRGAAQMVRDRGMVLMVDEVQTGNGRTGALYSYMNYGITPDVVTTAKGLGGGLPLGAALLGERVANVLGYGDHGSTFGGNPVCCAGALSVLNRINDALLAEVREKGAFLTETFRGAPGVRTVSGMGLMIGIEPVSAAADVVRCCMEHGVLCLTAKNKVRLLPALNIPWPVLREAADVIRTACADLQ